MFFYVPLFAEVAFGGDPSFAKVELAHLPLCLFILCGFLHFLNMTT